MTTVAFRSRTDSSVLLAKILKDREKRTAASVKEKQAREARAEAGNQSEEEEDAQAARTAAENLKKTEEAAQDIERRKAAAAGPPIFAQVLFPVEVIVLSWTILSQLHNIHQSAKSTELGLHRV